MTRELNVSLGRGGQSGHYQVFSVPQQENQTVLDVVTYVQRHLDPSLSYRFACRVGVCGSCAMTSMAGRAGRAGPMCRGWRETAGSKSGRCKIFR
jgi:succinate dehydrogenase/fumarate reductase-like Fe-S protein